MSNENTQQSDTPDAPPEVIARQAKSRALTRETADLIKSKDYIDDGGRTVSTGLDPVTLADMAARKSRTRAEAYVGGTPVKGLTPETVAEIKGRDYEDAPAMDVELGDRTPAFVNWLYAKHPEDAKVRFAYRDIWPTVLPAAWPPLLRDAVAPTKPTGPITVRRRKVPSRAKTEATAGTPANPSASSTSASS